MGTPASLTTNVWEAVCNVDSLLPGVGACVLAKGVQIAIFRMGNDIHAIANHDPFSNANVVSRGITGSVRGRRVVASPVYKHHFDLQTGTCLEYPDVALQIWPARVREGVVEIQTSQ